MNLFSRLTGSVSLALALATPAVADVTAEQVWAKWQESAAGFGQTITVGSQDMAAGTLTLTDVAMSMTLPEGTLKGLIPQIVMTEQADGRVAVTMAPEYSIDIAMDPAEGESMTMTVVVAAPDLATVVSGDPDRLTYDIAGPSLTVATRDIVIEGVPSDTAMTMVVTDVTGGYDTTANGADRTFSGRMDAGTLTVNLSGSDPERPGATFDIAASYVDINSTSEGAGDMSGMADPARMFAPGVSFTSRYTHGGGTVNVNSTDPDTGAFSLASLSAGGALDASLKDGTLGYQGSAQGLKITASGATIPFPELTAAMDEMAFGMTLPLAKTEQPTDFGLLLNLSGLSVSDEIWSMLDPGAVLPHDPATLIVDLAGKAKMLMNFGDPAAAAMTNVPAELHALDLRNLRLSIAGADLTGTGSFTFDNTDKTTFPGMPAPSGSVDLQLVGGNALLDKLVQMGLLPQDQAMGARMMLGLFAKPVGEDTLTSKIEVTPDGGLLANGQRLQ